MTTVEKNSVVDVVIVNWNTSEKAIKAAEHFAASRDVDPRVVIVDNDSVEEQKALLRETRNEAFDLIETGSNLGFGGAANLGLSKSSGDFVVVSNADIIPPPDTLAALVAAAEKTPSAGMVGPVFRDDGNHYHDHLPSSATLLLRIGFGRFGRKSISPPLPGEIARVEQPAGACFLMRRDVWNSVGGFDDSFFLWYEDVDLARRLIDSGHTNLIVGSAEAAHIGGDSFRKLSDRRKQDLRLSSLRRYISLHHRGISAIAEPLIRLSKRLRGV